MGEMGKTMNNNDTDRIDEKYFEISKRRIEEQPNDQL